MRDFIEVLPGLCVLAFWATIWACAIKYLIWG